MRSTRSLVWCALLSVIGIGLCAYLTYLHLGLMRGELLGGAVCSGSGSFNCHAVTAGPWGSLAGMPLALWGVLGYSAILSLALFGWQSPELADGALCLIKGLAAGFVLIDLFLLFVMISIIRFYCLFCLITYAINLLLVIIAARGLRCAAPAASPRLGAALGMLIPSGRHPGAALFWGLLGMATLGVVGVHAASTFVVRGPWGSTQKQIREFVAKSPRVTVALNDSPTRGEPTAPVQIVEFSDFLCPACQRASKLNPVLLAGHRRDVLFTFKHYPLDTGCNARINRLVHAGACQVAAAAACAQQQGKFWPFHDLVFEKGHDYKVENLEADAARIGLDMPQFRACVQSGKGLEVVKRDIEAGGGIGVTSTPTYVVNGLLMPGGINPAIFEELLAAIRDQSEPKQGAQ